MYRAFAFVVCAVLSVPAFGHIFYDPVRSQYRVGDQTFYYGGSNPYVLDFAKRQAVLEDLRYYRSDFGRRYQDHSPVYSDLLPYRDMTDFNFTAADAQNEANAGASRYFNKRHALMHASRDVDGTVVVPAHPPMMMMHYGGGRYMDGLRYMGPTTRPMVRPRKGEVIIIPKDLLDRPLKSFVKPGKTVALAD